MAKTVEHYMNLPYTRELIPPAEPGGSWFVRIKELENCMSQGDTPEEALRMIEDAMRGWLEVELESGDSIPEPREEEDYSGKFVVRVPKSLHRKLAEAAEADGMSLNAWIGTALAEAAGVRRGLKLSGSYLVSEARSLERPPAALVAETSQEVYIPHRLPEAQPENNLSSESGDNERVS